MQLTGGKLKEEGPAPAPSPALTGREAPTRADALTRTKEAAIADGEGGRTATLAAAPTILQPQDTPCVYTLSN
jgi:hypothetical protein